MSKLNLLLKRSLGELNSDHNLELMEFLKLIVEELEEKNDPDPIELQIFNDAFYLLEKMITLKQHIYKYVSEIKELPGDRLSRLYDEQKPHGTSILFD